MALFRSIIICMKANLLKIIALGLAVPVTGLTFFVSYQIYQASAALAPSEHKVAHEAAAGGHGAPADAHGAPAADAHGAPAGGHGEAPKTADAHGAPAGGHGEAPKADAHGAPAADAHGAPAAGGERSTAGIGLVSVDEIFVNVGSGEKVKSVGLKLELEMFDESSRAIFDKKQSGIKDAIIEASREQDSDRLQTVAGKLYFKEYLVSKLNSYLKEPLVREVHFSSFYLQ